MKNLKRRDIKIPNQPTPHPPSTYSVKPVKIEEIRGTNKVIVTYESKLNYDD